MTQSFERAKTRFNNIKAIDPLLGALRTISMGAWQMALNKMARLEGYEEKYNQILVEILPHVEKQRLRKVKIKEKSPELADTILLIIGTERGLCGKFNDILIENTLSWIESEEIGSYQIWAMGSRMVSKLEQRDLDISWRNPLPSAEIASYQQAYLTTQNWLEQYESYAFNKFIVLFNQVGKGGSYRFSVFQLLPFEQQRKITDLEETQKKWPRPIVETDPSGIYRRIIQHYVASSFYKILLRSAIAENAARYNLMQEAKDNAEEILEELNRVINAERKRQITQEMQELAAGAGLLDNK